MFALVFAMIVCLVLGLAVVGVVAIPARREGRELLTPRGEEVVGKVREGTETVTSVARERTGELLSTGREKTQDLVDAARQRAAEAPRGRSGSRAD